MIYTAKTLDARIDNVQLSANVNKVTNPTRSTYEDGFANGLADVFQTVRAQEAKIKALIKFYQSVPVDVLRMKADNGFLDMEKVDKAVAAVELAFNGENV